jgi:hypothetical protein
MAPTSRSPYLLDTEQKNIISRKNEINMSQKMDSDVHIDHVEVIFEDVDERGYEGRIS